MFVYLVLCQQCAGGTCRKNQQVRAVKRHARQAADDSTFHKNVSGPRSVAQTMSRAAIHAVTCQAALVRAMERSEFNDAQGDRAHERLPGDARCKVVSPCRRAPTCDYVACFRQSCKNCSFNLWISIAFRYPSRTPASALAVGQRVALCIHRRVAMRTSPKYIRCVNSRRAFEREFACRT